MAARRRGFAFDVEGKLEALVWGRMTYWVLYLPRALQREAPFDAKKRLRMRGVAGDEPVAMAWQLSKGRHYVMFGKSLARRLGLSLGGRVRLAFDIVRDDDVDVPEEIALLLQDEPDWQRAWQALRPAQQRAAAHLVKSARRPDMRAQRAADVLRSIADGSLPGPPRRTRGP